MLHLLQQNTQRILFPQIHIIFITNYLQNNHREHHL